MAPIREQAESRPSLNLGSQIQSELMRTGISFNIMLVGEAGLGKSTAVRALFRPFSPKLASGLEVPAWLSPTTDVIRPRTVGIEEHTLTVESDGYPVNFTVVDCPGFGDSLDARTSIEPIVDCIVGKFAQYYSTCEAQHATRLGHDCRVHCCLYFIGAHRLKGIDIEFLKRLQPLVPIVPLIAKSDTLTTDELKAFHQLIVSELSAHGIEILAFAAEPDSPGPRTASAAQPSSGAPPGQPGQPGQPAPLVSLLALGAPFAVCASESGVRAYPWGTCDSEAHSDLGRLRSVLLTSNLMRAREATHELYERAYAASRRTEDARAARVGRRRLVLQGRAMRAALALACGGALAWGALKLRGALPASRGLQLDSAARKVGAGLAGASRATLRGVNAYALSPLASTLGDWGALVRPRAWAAALAKRLEMA